ncbi:MAG TPA: TonB-dependent receptor plug domain-containing protein, partial [Myxococcota bacterium]|nr:TonB-dependent receptor plug domain-containing protein [Myxococcota bacterium]
MAPGKRIAALVVILALLGVTRTHAGEVGPSDSNRPAAALDEVVVTGTRTEQRLADAPVATVVVTRREMVATGARFVSDLLRQQAGIDVDASFAGAGVRLQGLDPQHVLILVDGRRVTGRVNGALDLSRLALENVDRIEIVRGASSALYGSEALGGVINVITRTPRRPLQGDAQLSWGTRGNVHVGSQTGVRLGDWALRTSAGWHQADAYGLATGSPATTGNGYRELTLGQRTEVTPVPGVRLGGAVDYFWRDATGVDVSAGGAVLDRL